ncbi:MAG TPA: Omp28-related outer membrane protein [Candidatus Kapabacteria bacterium]|nr:Omp28-related outer membrane protein [Candidatus Kapabacteria bacterium]
MKRSAALLLLLCIPALSFSNPRTVLVEFSTNTSCGPCVSAGQTLDQDLTSTGRTQVAVIRYHTPFPTDVDPFYHDNAQESANRATYYGVSGNPQLYFDATNEPTTGSAYWLTQLQSEMQQSAPLAIALSGTRNGRSGNLNVTVTGSAPGNWKLFAVITESGLTFHGNNGEVLHNDVFRTTLTTWNGVDATSGSVQLPFTLGTGHDSDISSTDSTPWIMDSCRIVVWAQNVSSKAVYQAAQIWVDSLTAQSNNAFTFTSSDTLLAAPAEQTDVVAVGEITNLNGAVANIKGVRLINNLPTNWTTAICLDFCGSPTADTVPGTITAHGKEQFLLHFDPTTLPGEGVVLMKLYDANNPSDSIIKQFSFKTDVPTHFTSPTHQTIQTNTIPIQWATDLTGKVALQFALNDSVWNTIDSVNIAGGAYTWTPGFQAYNVRLRLLTSEGNILSSMFNMLPNAVAEPVPVSYALSCAPNPANALVNISLQGYPMQRVTIYDALGRSVYDYSISHPSVGMTVPVNTSALLPGVYFARVFTPSGVFGSQIVVTH